MVAHVLCKHEAGVRFSYGPPIFIAGVAQLVEHFLAKEDVTSSSLVTRSIKPT